MNARFTRSHPNLAPRPQICFIYLSEFCSLAAREISWRDLRKKTGVQECPTDTDLYLQKGYFL
ncbi:hypothetical protein DW833_03250 [Anaerobutyricum hallii]|uniref:Uncharacterized protein n=1 Tax=Anaerobutyricum hallii TaxID=39488 RepID=A0A374NUG9_9FIRM|nr:hypothetical protein [Anaerobutyricum hallii]RGI91531.1 hypothetical protein DXD91_02615 [Anaerobutyricum hallii]RHC66882.1 hypothetical protein DW833_03250 [Anaerobutyricum hallii]